jgi:hypothetical protein
LWLSPDSLRVRKRFEKDVYYTSGVVSEAIAHLSKLIQVFKVGYTKDGHLALFTRDNRAINVCTNYLDNCNSKYFVGRSGAAHILQ